MRCIFLGACFSREAVPGVALAFATLLLMFSSDRRVEAAEAQLFTLIRSGDAAGLRAALKSGVSVSVRDGAGNTPAISAAAYGSLDSLRALLDHGAEVNATNARGATALMRAAYDPAKVALLLERGADVSQRSGFGTTALMLAARTSGSHRSVKALLERGADVNATNLFGATALMAATASGDLATVRLLLEAGADPNAHPVASEAGFLFGGGRSPLMWAAFRGNLPIMNRLLEAGARVDDEGLLGTPLIQAAWADRLPAAALLLKRGADAKHASRRDGFTPLHWAASTEGSDPSLVRLLLRHGGDPEQGGGEQIDAFMDVLQTPVMLAEKRGPTPVLAALRLSARNVDRQEVQPVGIEPLPEMSAVPGKAQLRIAIERALPLLMGTALESKQAFVRHASKQDCTSCHQQYLPLAAAGIAKRQGLPVEAQAEAELIRMVAQGEFKDFEPDWEPLFHPDAAGTKGYTLLAYALAGLPADDLTDAAVHHLAAIQGPEGQWHNNLPRPPLQTGDIGATALGVQALQRYPLAGRKTEFQARVDKARRWLARAEAASTDSKAFQLLGLSWAGETADPLRAKARALIREQRPDGGWGQLTSLPSDAYATGQALYALQVAAGLTEADPAIQRGRRFLLQSQLADGSWRVRRRAFPFQPTMPSGFPHGRDSWISAAGTSWAVMALSLGQPAMRVAARDGFEF